MSKASKQIAISIPDFSVPESYDYAEKQQLMKKIADYLKQNDTVLISHYYTSHDVQELTEFCGGFIGDSLAMAKYGLDHSAKNIIVCGVKFMGETAKILSPDKNIFMPTLNATCSLDLGCPADEFEAFCKQYPDRTAVVYANTSAKVKAIADWVVTSSNALEIIDYLDSKGEKIIWAPDKYLGSYIKEQTSADMVLWDGACIVHEEFKAQALLDLKKVHPNAAVLVHPESPASVVAIADVVGSTSKLLSATKTMDNDTFIVATDSGIFYKMKQSSPDKTFIEAPTSGQGATCRSCARCPWMSMNQLSMIDKSLFNKDCEITLDPEIIKQAQISLNRMVLFPPAS